MSTEPRRLHSDDIAALADALRMGAFRTPPNSPAASDILTGNDGRLLREVVRDIVAERVSSFLPRQDIEDLIDKRVRDRLGRIGLQVDEDHIEETGQAVRGALRWHGRIDKVFGGIAVSVILAAVYAVARLIGINLPPANGGGVGGH